MKNVVSQSEVAHMWANKLQYSARNAGGNFYFENNTIFSYGSHFPIAKHIECNGVNAVLFTESSYSNTTAKHIQVTRGACSHKNIIYCNNPNNSHDENFNSWKTTIENIATKLPKAKKPEIYLYDIGVICDKVNKYASFFGISIPETLIGAMQITDKNKYAEYTNKKAEYEKAEKIRIEKKQKKEHAAALKKFRSFETSRLYSRNGFDYLRYNKDSERVETSQGVQVPKDIAIKFYNWLTLVANKGGCTNCNLKLLSYDITEVTKDSFTIGCHTISMKEAKNCYMSMQ